MPEELLVPLDQYLKVGIHIGTKYRNKFMQPFIYKIRPDGLSVLNVQILNLRLKMASAILSQYEPEDILIACRRENGWEVVKEFTKATGIRSFPGRYPPGILTNPNLDTFIETKILLVVDPWPDRNAIEDANRIGIPVIALCDTNNNCTNIDYVVPCNNKGRRSLGLIFWILAKEYLKSKKQTFKVKPEIFIGEEPVKAS